MYSLWIRGDLLYVCIGCSVRAGEALGMEVIDEGSRRPRSEEGRGRARQEEMAGTKV